MIHQVVTPNLLGQKSNMWRHLKQHTSPLSQTSYLLRNWAPRGGHPKACKSPQTFLPLRIPSETLSLFGRVIVMRKISLTILAISLVTGLTVLARSGAQSQDAKTHSEWMAQSLREMETIKVGMTRADLLRVFMEAARISAR